MLSQQLLVKNNQYGFDPVMFYMEFYVPKVAQGLDIRVGRYISLPDIEAQLAPNNYSYSHSILYTVDCYTQTGINATVKINDHWTVQAGLSAGCDTMPWTTDAKLTGNFCAQYTWSNGGNDLYTCANSVNDGKYAYNNLAAYYETWYHRINATWHTDTEFWYQYEKTRRICTGSTAPIPPPASSTPTPPAPPGPRPPSIAPARAPSTSTLAPSARIPAFPPPTARPLLRSRARRHQLRRAQLLARHRLAQHPQRVGQRHRRPAHRNPGQVRRAHGRLQLLGRLHHHLPP